MIARTMICRASPDAAARVVLDMDRAILVAILSLWGCAKVAIAAPPAGSRPVLVELYTSQGCSSCPPADRFVLELPARGLGPDKVVALTFHVDYWNHLGWADPFAMPSFTRAAGLVRGFRSAPRPRLRSRDHGHLHAADDRRRSGPFPGRAD